MHVNIIVIYGELCNEFDPFNTDGEKEPVCLQWRSLVWQHHKKAVLLFYFIPFYHFKSSFLGFVISSFIFPSFFFVSSLILFLVASYLSHPPVLPISLLSSSSLPVAFSTSFFPFFPLLLPLSLLYSCHAPQVCTEHTRTSVNVLKHRTSLYSPYVI